MKRFFLCGMITIIILLISAWLFAGRISKNYLEDWLKGHGAEDVTIQSMILNPFTLSVSVQNADIRGKKGSLIRLENAFINFSLQGLFQREVQVSEAVIRGVSLSVKKDEHLFKDGSFFPPLVKTPWASQKHFDSRMWKFRLIQASVLNSNIHVQLPELNCRIQMDNCLVWDALISGDKNQGSFSFSGDVNGAEVKMESTFGMVEKSGSALCKISLKKIALTDFQGFLPDSVSQLQGDFSFDSMIDVDMEKDRIEISQKGKGDLVHLKVVMYPYTAENAAADFQENFLITLRQNKISSLRMVATLNSQDFQVTDTDTDFTIMKWKNVRAEKAELSYKESFLFFGKSLLRFNAIRMTPFALDRTEESIKPDILPLDVAAGYLLDMDGNLELEVPLSGSLDDPGFRLSDFFQSIVMKAVRSSAYRVIQTRILPYSILVQDRTNAAIYDEGQLINLRLDPVVFAAGEVLPGVEADEYTRQLSELMKQEAGLRIIICGFSTHEDRNLLKIRTKNSQELDRMLLDIARERADTFREILVSHYGVPSSRILNCQPSFDAEKDAKPRIEIEL
ncbi:MAG: hypothetical protein C0403_16455 [Desulfobacterium sp.]|nr:hypothetical protein [Desulfobacterium sp.]